jgi:hypothetical protein
MAAASPPSSARRRRREQHVDEGVVAEGIVRGEASGRANAIAQEAARSTLET